MTRRQIVVNASLVALVAAGGAFAATRVGGSSTVRATVRTATVQRGVVLSTVSASGNLQTPQSLAVNFASTGKLVRIYVKTGQQVKRGQPLAQLLRDNRVWGARQSLVQQALPGLSVRELAAALIHAARLDRMIKGLERGDVWDEFLQLGLRLAQSSGALPALA